MEISNGDAAAEWVDEGVSSAVKTYHFAFAREGNQLGCRFIATNALRSFFRHAEACKVALRNGRMVI